MITFKQYLNEVSTKTLKSYINGAITDQVSVKWSGMTSPKNGKNVKQFIAIDDIKKHIEKREKGINKAEDSLDRKRAIAALYKRLGVNKP